MQYIPLAVIGFVAGGAIMLAISGRRRNGTPGRAAHAKEKREFSKSLAIWAAFTGSAVIMAAIVLSIMDKQTLESFFITVFTSCSGYLVTYAGKSAYEKNSRNKHGLDEDGRPFDDDGGVQ